MNLSLYQNNTKYLFLFLILKKLNLFGVMCYIFKILKYVIQYLNSKITAILLFI